MDTITEVLSRLAGSGSKYFHGTGDAVGPARGLLSDAAESDYGPNPQAYCEFLRQKGYQVDCSRPTVCDPQHSCTQFTGSHVVCAPPDMYGKCP